MISVTSGFLEAMETGIFSRSAVITLANGTELDELDEDDFTVNGSSFSDSAGDTRLPVGVAISRVIQLELLNQDGRYADVSFTGATVDLTLSLIVSGEPETFNVGHFTVLQPETYGDTVVLSAQDDMYKADKPFGSSLSYPATAGALWAEICTSCGITNGMQTIPQSTYVIASAPSSDLTYRAVLGYIAMLSGGNARINRSGALEIVNYDFSTLDAQRTAGTATGIHDLTMWRELKLDREDVAVTGVRATVYDNGAVRQVLSGSDGYVLDLENPLFALNIPYPSLSTYPSLNVQETQALNTIASAIVGHSIRGFSGEYIEYPLAEFGDGARLTDAEGNTYYTILTDMCFTWFAPTEMSCKVESALQNASRYTSQDTTQRMLVDQEAAAREAAVSSLQSAIAAANGMYQSKALAAEGGGYIYYLHDKPDRADSQLIVQLGSTFSISTDGGATWPYGMDFATATAVLNILNVNGINADWITAGTLDADRIAANSIEVGKLTGSVTNSAGWEVDLEHGSITVGNISAGKVTTGTMSADRISGGSIDATNVTITNLNASNITSGSLSASNISGGTLNGDNMTVVNMQANSLNSVSGDQDMTLQAAKLMLVNDDDLRVNLQQRDTQGQLVVAKGSVSTTTFLPTDSTGRISYITPATLVVGLDSNNAYDGTIYCDKIYLSGTVYINGVDVKDLPPYPNH